MKAEKMKTAVLGCGVISDAYLSTITKKFKILDVVGCCDNMYEKAAQKAEQYGIKTLTFDEIISGPSIELVINLTPSVAHYETNKQLLNAGKHVYSEKTLAVELEEAAELVNLAKPYTMTCENLASGTVKFQSGVIGNLLFDSNSIVTLPERPVMVVYGTQGILYMSDPNLFGGEVKVILKGNNEPVVMPQSHPFETESRGLGAAEMAWSIRKGRKHRANKEMAYHALEVLHGMKISGETQQHYQMKSTFEKQPALPRGYKNMAMVDTEENAIAL